MRLVLVLDADDRFREPARDVREIVALGIDIMIVDRLHVFMALHAHSLQNRQCCIHVESEVAADALSEWLLTVSPIIDYRHWQAKYEQGSTSAPSLA